MSLILSNGYKKPESGDLGTSFFPDLENNIQRVNDHTHNGVNSNKLTPLSFALITDTIDSGDFSLVSDRYRSLETVPAGTSVAETTIAFRDATTKQTYFLDIELVTPTTYYVYSMFPLDLEVVYG